MNKTYKLAGAIAMLLGLAVMAISPVLPGPPLPFPDDGPGGNIAAHSPLLPGPPLPFPDDGPGGNLV